MQLLFEHLSLICLSLLFFLNVLYTLYIPLFYVIFSKALLLIMQSCWLLHLYFRISFLFLHNAATYVDASDFFKPVLIQTPFNIVQYQIPIHFQYLINQLYVPLHGMRIILWCIRATTINDNWNADSACWIASELVHSDWMFRAVNRNQIMQESKRWPKDAEPTSKKCC